MDFVPWTDSLNRICQKWETFDCSLGIDALPPLLYQHITDVRFENIIKESLSVSTDGSMWHSTQSSKTNKSMHNND